MNYIARGLWANLFSQHRLRLLFSVGSFLLAVYLALQLGVEEAQGHEFYFDTVNLTVVDTDQDGFNDTFRFTCDVDTDRQNESLANLSIRIEWEGYADIITMGQVLVNGTANETYFYNYTAFVGPNLDEVMTGGNYTFKVALGDEFYNWTHYLRPTQGAWLEPGSFGPLDTEEDGFVDSVSGYLYVATWANYTQSGWLDFRVVEDEFYQQVDRWQVPYNITGFNWSDPLFWDWTPDEDGFYTIYVTLYNETMALQFDQIIYGAGLELAYEWFWLEQPRVESHFHLVDMVFDVDTWHNQTYDFTLEATMYLGTPQTTMTKVANWSSGNASVSGKIIDPWQWRFEAEQNGTFTLGVWLNNSAGELFQVKSYQMDLQVVEEGAWFDTATFQSLDTQEDGFAETVLVTMDIDTFDNDTQAGLLYVYILDQDQQNVHHNFPGTPYVVLGEADLLTYYTWEAPQDGTYTVYLQLQDLNGTTVLDEFNQSVILRTPYPFAWFTGITGLAEDNTALFDLDVDTWHNQTQSGYISVNISNDGTPLTVTLLSYNATSDDADDLFNWSWNNVGFWQAGNYTFTFILHSANLSVEWQRLSRTLFLNETLIPNIPPVAFLEVEPADNHTVGEEVVLDASASLDHAGQIVLYEWDLDGDGLFEVNGTESNRTLTLAVVGELNITVRVTDDRSATDTTTRTLQVQPKQAPPPQKPQGDDDDGGGRGWCLWPLLIVGVLGLVGYLYYQHERKPRS